MRYVKKKKKRINFRKWNDIEIKFSPLLPMKITFVKKKGVQKINYNILDIHFCKCILKMPKVISIFKYNTNKMIHKRTSERFHQESFINIGKITQNN